MIRLFARRWWPLLPLLLFTGHNWFGPDQWYHLAWGRAIWETANTLARPRVLIPQPMVANVYWLYQLFSYATYAVAGAVGVSALFSGIWLLIAGVWAKVARADGRTFLGACSLLVFTVGVQLRLEYRPEIFSYLAFILVVLILNRSHPNRATLIQLFALEVLWSNVHGYFVLGPLLAGLSVLASLLEGKDSRFLLKAFVVMSLATLVTPQPAGAWKMLWAYRDVLAKLRGSIEELRPTANYAWWYWPMPLYWLVLSAVLVGSAYLLVRRRQTFAALTALLGGTLSLIAFRNVPFLVLGLAPLVGVALREAPKPRHQVLKWATAGLVVLVAALSGAIVQGAYYRALGSTTRFGWRVDGPEYPVAVARFLNRAGFKGRLFNDTNDGGYLEFHLPKATVLADSYFSDPSLTLALFETRDNARIFESLEASFHFQALVVGVVNENFLSYLLHSTSWSLAFADLQRLVFLPRTNKPDPIEFEFYRGEDLTNPSYSAALSAWADFKMQTSSELNRALAKQLATAPCLPTRFVERYGDNLPNLIRRCD